MCYPGVLIRSPLRSLSNFVVNRCPSEIRSTSSAIESTDCCSAWIWLSKRERSGAAAALNARALPYALISAITTAAPHASATMTMKAMKRDSTGPPSGILATSLRTSAARRKCHPATCGACGPASASACTIFTVVSN